MAHSSEAEPEAASFPALLRYERVQAGLTQRRLADLSTISPRTIRDLESGRARARTQTVRLLADALRLQGLPRELFVRAGIGTGHGHAAGPDLALVPPRPVNALLGRELEVQALAGALESGRRRMVAFSGLPGVGKSRLAAEIAGRISARRGWPVLWLGARARPPGEDAPGTAARPFLRSLRLLLETGAQDVSEVCRILGRHETLLVLDGLADTRAPAGVEELLAYCPGVRVISTSRTPWHVAGVQVTVVAPLATPELAEVELHSADASASTGAPSLRLLLDRLAEVRPGFTLDAAEAEAAALLCRRLDGLPVALEAAAAKLRVLSLREVAEGSARSLLELPVAADPARGPETLGDLIGAGLVGLDPAHRAVLDALACRDGAWTVREAADALGRPVAETVDALDVLTGRGLVLASREEPETRLHVPSLLRTLLAAAGTDVS